MRYRIQCTSILSRQRGALRRQRWYAALDDARPIRRARSQTATYRALNRRRRALCALAASDRQRSNTLYARGARWHSVSDPVEAEVLRLRCELYCALAQGHDAEQAFQAHYERARVACEAFNAQQEAALKQRRSWHNTDIGYFSADEAWTRLRHAITMYRRLCAA
jgi:hypothetical protein